MAQRRMIDKRISVSEQVANLPVEAQLIFTWMIPHADDVGLLPYSARTLKALVVPMMDFTTEAFNNYLESMRRQRLIAVFEWKGEKFWRIVRFSDTQTLKKDRNPQTTASGIDDWKTVESIWNTPIPIVEDNGNPTEGPQPSELINSGADWRPEIPQTGGDMATLLRGRYDNYTKQKKTDSSPWKEKALRYAEKLRIQLPNGFKGRWIKVFRQAHKGRKVGNLEDAYTYLVDRKGVLTDEEKIKFFFSIYENGLQDFSKKG